MFSDIWVSQGIWHAACRCVSGAVGVPCVEYMMLLKGVKNMKQMKRGLLFAVTVMIALSIVGCGQKQTEYPSKDIELVIPWSAEAGQM